MIKSIREANNFLCKTLEPYIKDSAYFVNEINHDDMIIYLDWVNLNPTKRNTNIKLKTAYIPFFLEGYKIVLL